MRTNDLSHLTILPNLIFERKTGACPSGAPFGHPLIVQVPWPRAIKDLQITLHFVMLGINAKIILLCNSRYVRNLCTG